ncbi:asparagine synthase (glutamine-hydrolyzing) [Lactobacillus sp. UCMA15818]|uniref:asparagine synthase (glutamine-hydrolyzing) n=1 Tax=Lactobacillus sp. UCMA15818 TaxID=2583394 RepID=UPI0025B22B78|nr:asparagine synthase (glutamine-hydrolyzing) [Lactobacillus sp. UCMA15818]MDN2453425.1 asparagine synthase (glutamine-hydrolyzing) [Lactobacillus sp. UCMA15818]
MCGFVGLLTKSMGKNEIKYKQINDMNNMIIHRGPDDEGYFQDKNITMGFRRLSIVDIKNGHQPMAYDNERFWLTFNGEIYNYIELRRQLEQEGYAFKTDTDSEVVLAMYSKYSEKCVSFFRGMFAFVIWDSVAKKLFAARDHFGIKPFYYSISEGNFYYASENKAIYKILQKKSLNENALQDYMTYQYVPENETMYENVESLQPGYSLSIEPGGEPKVERYFYAEFEPIKLSEREYEKQIRDCLVDSVEKHMRADVPVGSFLSGGIDSAIIVSLAKQFNSQLETFSVGFEQEGYSELDVAKKTAAQLGVKNTSYIINPEEFMQEFPHFVWSMDDPLADPAAIPQYFVAREARKKVKVALTGEGADEFFGGYRMYHEPLSLKFFEHTKRINKMLNQIAHLLPEGVRGRNFILRGTTPLEERYAGNAFIFNEKQKNKFFKNYNCNHTFQLFTKSLYQDASKNDAVSKMQFIDVHTWLSGDLLHNADRTTMAHSLELRTPFVDKDVFEVARHIPSEYKISHGTTKYILRKAVKGLVPSHVLERRKLGFPVPIRVWLRAEMYEWARDIIKKSQTDKYFDKNYFLNLLEEHRRKRKDNSRKIWTILTFMVWYQVYGE